MKQNRYGDGGTRGRRMALPAEELVDKALSRKAKIGVGIGAAAAPVVYGQTRAALAGHPGGRPAPEPKGIRFRRDMQAKVKKLYDPESRRQRRLGAAQALLAGGGIAAGAKGVKGIKDTTRAMRRVQGVTGAKDYSKDVYLARDTLKSRKAIVARRGDAGLVAGGAAGLSGAGLLQAHAEGKRGRGWN